MSFTWSQNLAAGLLADFAQLKLFSTMNRYSPCDKNRPRCSFLRNWKASKRDLLKVRVSLEDEFLFVDR